MKKLCLMTVATMLMVSCGSDDEIKLNDQTGFHQAVSYGGEHGRSIKDAESYEEFTAARETIQKHADAFRTQLGGESYLAYLKAVTSAINGRTLSESDIDRDADILYIRKFYNTATEKENENDPIKLLEKMGADYGSRLKKAESREAYNALCDEIKQKEAALLKEGNMDAYIAFIGNVVAYTY